MPYKSLSVFNKIGKKNKDLNIINPPTPLTNQGVIREA
jgi:hypothetical protein